MPDEQNVTILNKDRSMERDGIREKPRRLSRARQGQILPNADIWFKVDFFCITFILLKTVIKISFILMTVFFGALISHSGQALREHLGRREQWPESPENACFSEDPAFEVDSEE